MSDRKPSFGLPAVILSLGLLAAAFVLGYQFKNLRQPGVITVKGLAEARHHATVGTWQVGVKIWGGSYADARTKSDSKIKRVKAFLQSHGFDAASFQSEDTDISVRTGYYTDAQGERHSRENGYDAKRTIVISTKDLDKLKTALAAIQDLRAEDDSVNFENPKYYLENLESIKRDLIAKATQDAQVRAEEFAKTGNAKVGAMQSASQGSFDIQSPNPSSEDNSDYGGSYDTSTVEKNVRLVVTIQYGIE